jgi:hypothetical protein
MALYNASAPVPLTGSMPAVVAGAAAVEPVVDALAALVQAVVDAVAANVQPFGAGKAAVGGGVIGAVVEPVVHPVAAAVEAVFDTVAAVVEAAFDTIAIGMGQGRAGGQQQGQGKQERGTRGQGHRQFLRGWVAPTRTRRLRLLLTGPLADV